MGGYVTRYENDNFDFLTIRGSGHMVPQFKPAAALVFLQSFIGNVDYPTYDAECTAPGVAVKHHGHFFADHLN